jgi:hypothetical protein
MAPAPVVRNHHLSSVPACLLIWRRRQALGAKAASVQDMVTLLAATLDKAIAEREAAVAAREAAMAEKVRARARVAGDRCDC